MNKAYGLERANPDHVGFLESLDRALTDSYQTMAQIRRKSNKLRGLDACVLSTSSALVTQLYFLRRQGTVEVAKNKKGALVFRKVKS